MKIQKKVPMPIGRMKAKRMLLEKRILRSSGFQSK